MFVKCWTTVSGQSRHLLGPFAKTLCFWSFHRIGGCQWGEKNNWRCSKELESQTHVCIMLLIKKKKEKKKKLPITFNYLLDIAIPSKGLSSNNFITDDCTRDAEERPKEHYGRMMDDEFAVNACGLPSPADVHLLFSPSNNHFFFFCNFIV